MSTDSQLPKVPNILFLDDSQMRFEKTNYYLTKKHPCRVFWCTTPKDVITYLKLRPFDFIFLDGDLSVVRDIEITGEDVCHWINQIMHDDPTAECIANFENAVFIVHSLNPIKNANMVRILTNALKSTNAKVHSVPYGSLRYNTCIGAPSFGSNIHAADD